MVSKAGSIFSVLSMAIFIFVITTCNPKKPTNACHSISFFIVKNGKEFRWIKFPLKWLKLASKVLMSMFFDDGKVLCTNSFPRFFLVSHIAFYNFYSSTLALFYDEVSCSANLSDSQSHRRSIPMILSLYLWAS